MLEYGITSLAQVCERLLEREAAFDNSFGPIVRALEAHCDTAREWKAAADAFLETPGGR